MIEKTDKYGSTKIEISYPHDDLYLYARISGAYFLIFSFIIGILFGVGISIFFYNYFIK